MCFFFFFTLKLQPQKSKPKTLPDFLFKNIFSPILTSLKNNNNLGISVFQRS